MILFINNGWWYAAMSGGDLHIVEVAARWARRLKVAIAMPRWAYELHADQLRGVQLVPTGLTEKAPPRSLAGASVRYMLRSFSKLGASPALVVAASHYPYDLIPAWIISRRRNRPLVVYLFHLASTFRKSGPRAAAVSAWESQAIRLMGRAALVLADNDAVVDELVARGIPRARISRTWNASTDQPKGLVETRTTNEVVYCHGISDTKGWQDLLVIGVRLRERCPGAVLRVLGDGPRRKTLERMVEDAHLAEIVRVEGYVDEETKWRALLRAVAFISPSREEGWGIAVGEALDAGAPVICYDLPVYREVHGEHRLRLVPRGDPDAFADAVVDVVHHASAQSEPEPPESEGTPSIHNAPSTWDEIAQIELDLISGLPGFVAAGGLNETQDERRGTR
jgi:glycosyltransferase involved in cell wall biosynthesis